jgi:hypothetical protein
MMISISAISLKVDWSSFQRGVIDFDVLMKLVAGANEKGLFWRPAGVGCRAEDQRDEHVFGEIDPLREERDMDAHSYSERQRAVVRSITISR